MTGKKCTKKPDARAELLFCRSKPVAFLPFSMTSLSSFCLLNSLMVLSLCLAHAYARIMKARTRLRPWDWVGVEITLWILWENEFWSSSVLRNLVIAEKHGESETNVPWCNSRQRRASLLLGHKMADSLNMRKTSLWCSGLSKPSAIVSNRFFPHKTPSKFELLSYSSLA